VVPLAGALAVYYSYLDGAKTGVDDLLCVVDIAEPPPNLVLAALQITWLMVVQTGGEVLIPMETFPMRSPRPTPLPSPEPGHLSQTPFATQSPAETYPVRSPPPTWTPPATGGFLRDIVIPYYLGLPQDLVDALQPLFHRDNAAVAATAALDFLTALVASTMWSERDPLRYWVDGSKLNFFSESFPLDNPDEVSVAFTDLERLFVVDVPFLPEALVLALRQWLALIGEYRLPMLMIPSHPYFTGQLIYFITSALDTLRLRPLLGSLIDKAIDAMQGTDSTVEALLPLICVLEIAIVMTLIAFLFLMARRFRRVISLLMFFRPAVALQNATVATLLLIGTVPAQEAAISFEHAGHIVENTREAVVIADRDLIIRDLNAAAERLIGNVRGTALAQALPAPPDEPGMESAIAAITDVMYGRVPPPLQDKLKINTASGLKIVALRATHLTELGILAKGDSSSHVRAVLIQIDDLTEQSCREQEIAKDADRIKVMLSRITPHEIVEQLAGGTESVSFSVQSASIGCIKVRFGSRELSIDNPFGGIHKLFALFDEWMGPFQQLSKVSVIATEYVFAGGIFTGTNKPEKHAEETTRFALKILTHREEIAAAAGPDISILIGMNTGGPLVGGVMNVHRPLFQLLGLPVRIAHEIAGSGVAGQLHVTRAVYELVYSHNFRVIERGDTKLFDGSSVHTYMITP
jgi:PAS domain-containing protein